MKILDLNGLQTYHSLLKEILESDNLVIAAAFNNLNDRIINLDKKILEVHPNLSTQVSILPYKFGNYNMYEVLCPYINGDFDTSEIPKNATIVEGSVFGNGYCEGLNSHWGTDENNNRKLYITNIVNEFEPEFALVRFYVSGSNNYGYSV